jgi:hypothetical protein
MEVHAPHEPIHTWRDFFLHIVTITVGLLIAIALEQTVEWIHHRHIVHVARENIRHEIEGNEKSAQEDLGHLADEAVVMKQNIERIRQLRTNPSALSNSSMSFNFQWSSFDQAAWLSARDSGALAYMPADEVQRYADLYHQQQIVSDSTVQTFTLLVEAPAPLIAEADSADLKPEETQAMLQDTARVFIRLTTLRQIVQQLDRQYKDNLKQ